MGHSLIEFAWTVQMTARTEPRGMIHEPVPWRPLIYRFVGQYVGLRRENAMIFSVFHGFTHYRDLRASSELPPDADYSWPGPSRRIQKPPHSLLDVFQVLPTGVRL